MFPLYWVVTIERDKTGKGERGDAMQQTQATADTWYMLYQVSPPNNLIYDRAANDITSTMHQLLQVQLSHYYP